MAGKMRWPTVYECLIAACLFNFVYYGFYRGHMTRWAQGLHMKMVMATTLAAPMELQGLDLVVLPLGDSITWGFQSSDGNGYRKTVYDNLSGNNVTMVGSERHGSMAQNRNEGHNGAVIGRLEHFAKPSLALQPNIVLLHAGTNDIYKNVDPERAPARLGSLIDSILDSCPSTTLLVAQIIGTKNETLQREIDIYNAAIPGIVRQRRESEKKHVLTVDMTRLLDTSTDYQDFLHPNDKGYAKIGSAWYEAILEAAQLGWLADVDKSGEEDAAKVADSILSMIVANDLVSDDDAAADAASTTASTAEFRSRRGRQVRGRL